MFKRVASEALGLSDIGKVIDPADYDKVEADDYVNHEEEEKIFFLIKSKADEYCFTNMALIHVDGTSALSKKRLLKRYDYAENMISDVKLETAGTVDLDIEIKFQLGSESYSIDVDKNQIEQLKDLYKALGKIGMIQKQNAKFLQYAENSLTTASNSIARTADEKPLDEQFKAITKYAFDWMMKAHATYVRKDFSHVFEMYINK